MTITSPAPTPPDETPTRRIPSWLTRTLVVLAASSTLVWIGAIIYGAVAEYHLAGYLEDRRFPTAAEPICKKAMADVKKFPPAPESKTPADRADVVAGSTARLQQMLDDLSSVVPPGADAKWINQWLADWRVHLSDRMDFVDRLRRKGASQEFFESTKAGTQISKSLDNYAEINKMPSCATPADV